MFTYFRFVCVQEPDADTLSVGSFPKPVLPPFFASSKSLVQYSKNICFLLSCKCKVQVALLSMFFIII